MISNFLKLKLANQESIKIVCLKSMFHQIWRVFMSIIHILPEEIKKRKKWVKENAPYQHGK